MRTSLVAGAALVACFALTSCGDDDKSSGNAQTPSTQPTSGTSSGSAAPGEKTAAAAGQTVRAYLDAVFEAKLDAACALMTEDYQADVIKDATSFEPKKDHDCQSATDLAREFGETIGVVATDFKVGEATVEGDEAEVEVDAGKDLSDSTYTLEWSGDRWLVASDGT